MKAKNIKVLVGGEIQRQNKYNIITVSLLVSLVWIAFIYFLNPEDVKTYLPFFFFIDSTSMTLLIIGVNLFYEKKESTIKTLMVTPVDEGDIIISKLIASVFNNFLTFVILGIAVYLLKGLSISYIGLAFSIILVTLFHAILGLVLTFYSKNFTGLLSNMVIYMFLLMLPTIFWMFGIIPDQFEKVLLLSPAQASYLLLAASVGTVDILDIWISIINLIVFSILLYTFVIRRKFHEFVIKEGGVLWCWKLLLKMNLKESLEIHLW